MIFTETTINGVNIVGMERHSDERGFFVRAWCAAEFAARGLNPRLAQANIGFSPRRGTLRGMHYQEPPHAEAKLVRCTRGALYDVAVDLRPDSPMHRQWIGVELTPENGLALYVPEGCAHGCLTLAGDTEFFYHTSEAWAPAFARGVRYDDPAFNIVWPAPVEIVSEQDRTWPDYLARESGSGSAAQVSRPAFRRSPLGTGNRTATVRQRDFGVARRFEW